MFQIFFKMAYCVLCQEEHEMNANCMKNVMCKGCGEMGHLSISCTKTGQTASTSSKKITNTEIIENLEPTPSSCIDIRQVFDSDSDNAEETLDENSAFDLDNDEMIKVTELKGDKRKLTEMEGTNLEVVNDNVAVLDMRIGECSTNVGE
jgi:hypothetical protein